MDQVIGPVLSWIQHLPWDVIIAAGLTFVVGFLSKQAVYAKLLDTLCDLAKLVNSYKEAQADGKIDAAEAQKLIDQIQEMIADYTEKK